MRKILVVAFLFAASSCACGTVAGAVVGRRTAPTAMQIRIVEPRDQESKLFACKLEPYGLLCTDLERYLLSELEEGTRPPEPPPADSKDL